MGKKCRISTYRVWLLTMAVTAGMFMGLLPSCVKKQTPVERGIADQELYIANQTEPQDLDPHIVTGVPEFHILETLLEGLVIAEP